MSDTVIEIEKLTKIYRRWTPMIPQFWRVMRTRALDNLNLQVNKGEVFGLLGPNGSGKTTTMKICLGLTRPTSGRVRVLGREPTHVHTKERIGFLPEETYLYRFLNADETLDFYGRLFGFPREVRRERGDRLIRALGLHEARKRRLGEYSKGMMRRMGVAQALVNDPELVFLDEPTSGLDPLISRQIKDLILELRDRGKTVLLSSHLLADVEDVCDRIAILHLGVLRELGSVNDLLSVRDRLQVTVQGAGEDARQKLEASIREAGCESLEVRHPTETLEALFLKTIRDREHEGNSGGR